MHWLEYFTDPVLRAPTIGSMLMGLTAGLIGVIIFLRKESLVGETLSHAAYPGAILGVIAAAAFNSGEDIASLFILFGGGLTAWCSIYLIHWLEVRLRVPSDAALCFVLAATFGLGISLASHIQFTQAALYRKTLTLLYGQAATMTDFHVYLYGFFSLAVILAFVLLHKEILAVTFDRAYASSLGMSTRVIEGALFLLLVIAVIIGIRTVGVVLMSAMLIAPAVAARQFTHHLTSMFCLAGLFGTAAGFIGTYLSQEASLHLISLYPASRLSLPTGPVIVLSGAVICFSALLIAPQRGLISRGIRIARFRYQRLCENILKCIWLISQNKVSAHEDLFHFLRDHLNSPAWLLKFALGRLRTQGWIKMSADADWELTTEGKIKAEKIVRLHRLWEVYLADYIGVGAERVHCSAEEMEHVITPELEISLTRLLKNPLLDPHQQPIPSGEAPI